MIKKIQQKPYYIFNINNIIIVNITMAYNKQTKFDKACQNNLRNRTIL